jgi:hypothetical protein
MANADGPSQVTEFATHGKAQYPEGPNQNQQAADQASHQPARAFVLRHEGSVSHWLLDRPTSLKAPCMPRLALFNDPTHTSPLGCRGRDLTSLL